MLLEPDIRPSRFPAMLTPAPLKPSSFAEFFEQTVAACAADKVAAGRLKADGALRVARKEAALFAQQGGHSASALKVFAHNAHAQALYASLGDVVTQMNLAKPLAGA